jgi:putative lipoic acid-binding regulatory protein
MTEPEKLVFPCDYPIKVVGRLSNDLRARVDAVFARHFGALDPSSISERSSGQQNFLALTYVMNVTDPAVLEPLHQDLRATDGVLLVL